MFSTSAIDAFASVVHQRCWWQDNSFGAAHKHTVHTKTNEYVPALPFEY